MSTWRDLHDDEALWIDHNPARCQHCDHLGIFHNPGEAGECLVDNCYCHDYAYPWPPPADSTTPPPKV